MAGEVVLIVRTGVILVHEVDHRSARCRQVTGKTHIIGTKHIGGTGIREDVVVQRGSDHGEAVTQCHIHAEPVILHRITSETLRHTVKVVRGAIEHEVANAAVDHVVIVTRRSHEEQILVNVDGQTEPIALHRDRSGDVKRLSPEGFGSTEGQKLVQLRRTGFVETIGVRVRGTGDGIGAADGHVVAQPVPLGIAVEGLRVVPTLVVELIDVGGTGILSIGVVAVLTDDHPVSGDVHTLTVLAGGVPLRVLTGDEARFEPHVQPGVVGEVVHGTRSAYAILGAGSHNHPVSVHGEGHAELVGHDAPVRRHVAEGTPVFPIRTVELVHVDGTGIEPEGVIEFGSDGNPVAIGGECMTLTECNVSIRRRQGSLIGP